MDLNCHNILQAALMLIPKQTFKYSKFLGNEINSFGVGVPKYADPVLVRGSVQAVDLSLYKVACLDMTKNYRQIYVPLDVHGNDEYSQPDRFIINDSIWEVVSSVPWYEYNGWCGVLVVEIKELR